MHSTVIRHEEREYVLFHNGDFSEVRVPFDLDRGRDLTIPMEVLEEFIGRKLQADLVGRLERQTGRETLADLAGGRT